MSEIYENEHNKRKRAESQGRIRAKLYELQRILENPSSTDYFPDDIAAFRDWVDESKNLERIGSTGTMNQRQSPHNRALILRVKDCINRLNKRKKNTHKKRPPLRDQLAAAQAQVKEHKKLNEELVSQLHKLKFDYDVISNSNRRMREKSETPVRKVR